VSNQKTGKMNCKGCKTNLVDYLEGNLSEPVKREIKLHLEECPECKGFAEYLSVSLSDIERSKFLEADPYFFTRVSAGIQGYEDSLKGNFRLARILQPAVFFLLLLAAIWAGIEIGNMGWSSGSDPFITDNLDPLLNEMDAEPIETYLMIE
jgi:predicted anti-sigma-YlaC factor YlaD